MGCVASRSDAERHRRKARHPKEKQQKSLSRVHTAAPQAAKQAQSAAASPGGDQIQISTEQVPENPLKLPPPVTVAQQFPNLATSTSNTLAVPRSGSRLSSSTSRHTTNVSSQDTGTDPIADPSHFRRMNSVATSRKQSDGRRSSEAGRRPSDNNFGMRTDTNRRASELPPLANAFHPGAVEDWLDDVLQE